MNLDKDYLKAPFPYFGGKSKAAPLVWSLFGDVKNYTEPFLGSAAMLLMAPEGRRIETVNDADGFVVNFWRAVQADFEGVVKHADHPCTELDLFARHGWLVNRKERLKWSLEDPEYYDSKIAGWWVWGMCNWIGVFCEGKGPWVSNGANIVNIRQIPHLGDAGQGIKRQIPHLGNAGQGINRQIPHLSAGRGIESTTRTEFITHWLNILSMRLRDVRVACGDWKRISDSSSVTTRHGLTAMFLDPPYTKGAMDYAEGGVGGDLATEVRDWCVKNGPNNKFRIVLCGHDGEHDELLSHGWKKYHWKAGGGYSRTTEAVDNRKSETVWASPFCVDIETADNTLFDKK